MSLNNSSANNNNSFSSIDAEFGLTTNNNDTNKTMTNKSIDEQFANPQNIISKTFNYPNFGNPNAETELTVVINTDTNMIAWGYANRWYRLAPKLVSVCAGEIVATYDTDVQADRDELIDIIFDSVGAMKLRGKAVALLDALIGTVILGEWELSDHGVYSYNCASIMTAEGNLIDAQEVLRKDVVRAFWTSSEGVILTKKLRGNEGAWTEGCLEATMNRWGYAMPDKNNSKCAYVSNSIGVMGMSADGIKSIVQADKVGKFFSRHSMVKHISAEVEEPTFDALVSEVSGVVEGQQRFVVHNGILLNATYVKHPLISLISSDGGIISRKPITAISNKRLRGSFNLDILLCSEAEEAQLVREAIADLDARSQFKKVIELMTEELNALVGVGTILQPGDFVSFAGQVIITNQNNVPVELHRVAISKGEAINTSVRTLNVDFKTKVRDISYNHKLRGQWLKGMSFRNDNLAISIDGNIDRSDIIINDNCVKNVEGVYLRMFANATGQLVSWCKDGELRKVDMTSETEMAMGDILDMTEVDAWLKVNSRTAKITAVLDVAELDEFKEAQPQLFADVVETSLDNGMVQISFVANVISAPLVCAIELSSVAENYSVGRNLSPISSNYLSTFSVLLGKEDRGCKTAGNNIRKHAEKVAKTIKHCGSKKADAVFNLLAPAQLEALQSVLVKAHKNNNPRDLFSVLASKYPNGIKISGGVAVSSDKSLRSWDVFIPTHLIKVVGGFNPRDGFAYDDNIKNTYAFLLMVSKLDGKSLEAYHLVADYAMKIGTGLKLWKEETVSSSKSLTKGTSAFYNHGMKVIANPEVGYEMVDNKAGTIVSIPRVVLDETNPLVVANPDNPKLSMAIGKDGKYAKLVKDGDIVFVHRNPVIDLTPCVVRTARNQTICGKFVVAMPPSALVWSSHSDVDGDVLWLIPGKQIGFNNLEQAAIAMSHPLVGKDIANETMGMFCDGASLVGGIISKPNANFALDKSIIVEYMNSDIAKQQYPKYEDRVKARWDYVVEQAEKTSQHYVINTGKGYQCMFNAYSKFVSDALGGNINQQKDVLVGIKATSFVIYEEWALGGYSEASETAFVKLDGLAKELLGTKKKSFGNSKGNSRFMKLSVNESMTNAINLCSPYMAMAKVQSMIENSNKPSQKDEEYEVINLIMAKQSWVHFDAVRFGLFRTLTKGAFAYGDSSRVNPIFAKHYPADDNNPYQPVIAAWQNYVSYSM